MKKIHKYIVAYLCKMRIDNYTKIMYNSHEVINMAENKSKYDAKAKERTMKYMAEKRGRIGMNFPKEDLQRYKDYAKAKGYSGLTALFVELIEREMKSNPAD